MGAAIALVQLFNAAAPGIAQLVTVIARKDGTITVAAILNEADAQFDANLKQAADYFKSQAVK